VGYFDDKMGQPPCSFSPEFLEIDAEAGPWLSESQQGTPIDMERYPNYELELEEGVIWFGDQEHRGVVAAVQLVGSYTEEDHTWLWAWANPKSAEPLVQAVKQLKEEHPDVPEFEEPSHAYPESGAWALAAAAAYKMKSQTCFRLPGEVTLFVALYDITALEEGDPRATRPQQDPDLAMRALEDYAGPAMMHIGALLATKVEGEAPELDPVIAAIHETAENLESLNASPVGRDTPAADEALRLAEVMREAATRLSVPPGTQALTEAIQEVFALLRDIAQQYGVWPGEEQGVEDEEGSAR
jgi:hypothetical protein